MTARHRAIAILATYAAGAIALSAVLLAVCGGPSKSPKSDASTAFAESVPNAEPAAPLPLLRIAAWKQAEGDEYELRRLLAMDGVDVVTGQAKEGKFRVTAIRALAFANDFSVLPSLVAWLSDSDAGVRDAAAESLLSTFEQGHTALSEDAPMFRSACDMLGVAITEETLPRDVRVRAKTALEVMASFGCKFPLK